MKIKEYLETLNPKQEVVVVIENKEGSHIVADHEAGHLAKSSKSSWLRLEVVETFKRHENILIVTKDPEEKEMSK